MISFYTYIFLSGSVNLNHGSICKTKLSALFLFLKFVQPENEQMCYIHDDDGLFLKELAETKMNIKFIIGLVSFDFCGFIPLNPTR